MNVFLINMLLNALQHFNALKYPIQSKLLKEVLPEVIDPLLAIINSSLSLGYVPKTFKLTVIKPLIKKHYLTPKS